MAWDLALVNMVRALTGDVADPPAKDDDRIKQAIVVGGTIATQEYPFTTTYTFDLLVPDITPDPTEPATLDNIASALFSLKAACLLTMADYQSAVGTGIRVRDGDSEVDTTAGFKGYTDIIKLGPCGAYAKLLESLLWKRGSTQGGAVYSPYSSGDGTWGITSFNGIWHIRSFYDNWLRW
jgi:hypothetical protein